MRFPYLTAAPLLVTALLLSSEVFSHEKAARSSGERANHGCHAVQVEAVGSTSVSSNDTQRGRGRRSLDFSAREILDLRFDVELHPKDQPGLVQIDLYTPSGNLYETLKAELVPDDASTGRARHRSHGGPVLGATLPVAGSYITRRSLYGQWRVLVRLDGNESTCTRPTTFVLQP